MRRRVGGWLAVPMLLAALAAALWMLRRPTPYTQLVDAAASQKTRPIEGRLTSFPYAPVHDRLRSAGREVSRISASAGTVLSEGDAVEPRTSAIAALLYGRVHDAVQRLESLSQRSNDASVWSDLAAAQLALADAADDPRACAFALAAADRALALEPTRGEALFNRALALEDLGLRFAAVDAWKRYLAADGGSEWAVEARERLRRADVPTRAEAWKEAGEELDRAIARGDRPTTERIVAKFPQPARGIAEKTLTEWGEAFSLSNAQKAATDLAKARVIAESLSKIDTNSLAADVIAEIDRDEGSRRSLAEGLAAYKAGRLATSARKIAESLRMYERAERHLRDAHSVMESVAAAFHAHALIDAGDIRAAEKRTAMIEARHPPYDAVRGQVLWLRTRFASDAGRPFEALVTATAARELFERIGDIDNAARLRTAEAAMLALLGRDREAWHARHAALADGAASGKWNLVETALDAIARDELNAGHRDVARSLLELQFIQPGALPLARFNAHLWSAHIEAATQAREMDLRAMREAASKIPDAKQRADAEDEIRLAEGIAPRTPPEKAERLLSNVIAYRTANGLQASLPSIYVRRARARRTLGKAAEAEDDLERAVAMIETRRTAISDATLRDTFLGNSADAYQELADLQLARGQWREAFNTSEAARARLFADRAQRPAASLEEVIAATDASKLLAHYTVLPQRTLLVIVHDGTAEHRVIDIGRSEVEQLRSDLLSAIDQGKKTEEKRVASRLYSILAAPLREYLSRDRTLVLVPDEATYGIPFAALRNGERFLVEETTIAVALTALTTDVQGSTIVNATDFSFIADPEFSEELFPNTERLPGARRDARWLKSLFRGGADLVGPAATRAAFLRNVVSSDVFHVASHAFSSARDASLSLLALTPGDGDQGVLYLRDVQQLELPRRPLVVLAGCQTGSLGGGKGSVRSLAHAFLAAGSRGVIGTLWNVGDEATSRLTPPLYKTLANGKTAPAALRDAQLAVIHTSDTRDWAGFQVLLGAPRHSASH